jgi:hypothetical protein
MPRTYRLLAIFALGSSLSACSGGGSASVAPAAGGSAPASSQKATAEVTIFVPNATAAAKQRRPAFVASTTNGISISGYVHGNATPFGTVTADLSNGSSACTAVSGGKQCTASMPAVVGTDDFTFATYDVTPSTAGFGTAAHQLGVATLTSITIANGVTNNVGVALSGIINSLSLPGGSNASVYLPVASSSGISVQALDADGNVILAGLNTVTDGNQQYTDTYNNPITVTVAEFGGSGHTTVSVNGGTPGTSGQLTKSTDTLTFAYDGNASSGYYARATVSATGATSATKTINTVTVSATGNANSVNAGVASNTVGFSLTGQRESFTLTETNNSGAFSVSANNGNSAACPTGAAALTTSGLAGSGTSFSLAAGTVNSTGVNCQYTIVDTSGASIPLTATTNVTAYLYATTFGITGTCAGAQVIAPNLTCATNLYVPYVEISNLSNNSTTASFTSSSLKEPIGVAHDLYGNIYVADYVNKQIVEFAAGSTSPATPIATMSSATNIVGPDSLALDHSGNIYVSDYNAGTVSIYAPSSMGSSSAVPTHTISGLTEPSSIALDSSGDVFVVENNNASNCAAPGCEVVEYAPPSYSAVATYSVAQAAGVAVDSSGDVFIGQCCSDTNIYEYSSPSSLIATFSSSIPNFHVGFPGLAVDGSGHLYAMGSQSSSNLEQYGIFTVSNPSAALTIETFAAPTFSGSGSNQPGVAAQGQLSL